jgi:hypothetical protein
VILPLTGGEEICFYRVPSYVSVNSWGYVLNKDNYVVETRVPAPVLSSSTFLPPLQISPPPPLFLASTNPFPPHRHRLMPPLVPSLLAPALALEQVGK